MSEIRSGSAHHWILSWSRFCPEGRRGSDYASPGTERLGTGENIRLELPKKRRCGAHTVNMIETAYVKGSLIYNNNNVFVRHM